MARRAKRGKIIISREDREYLQGTAKSRTASLREVERARIILSHLEGKTDKGIAHEMGIHRFTAKNCLDKCSSMGMEAAIKDLPRPGAPKKITDEDKMFIVNLACKKPLELGYSYELWTYSLLLNHIHHEAVQCKRDQLVNLSRSKLWAILTGAEIRPHKIRYYLERRDSEFEEKMAQVLCVYKEVELSIAKKVHDKDFAIDRITVSYDEKPGIQAKGNISDDLLPVPGKHPTLMRDHEYVRYGTVSLLSGIDLHSGKVIAHVSKSHKSADFIEFLKKLQAEYPSDVKIRLILDNHSAHISKETKKYLVSERKRPFFEKNEGDFALAKIVS